MIHKRPKQRSLPANQPFLVDITGIKATSFLVDFVMFFWLEFCSFLDQVEINRFFAKKKKKIKVQDCVKSASDFR
jgi:hypothetical protein